VRAWLGDGHDLGQLVVNGLPGQPPAVIPTHFSVDGTPSGTDPLVHLARPDPVGATINADPDVVVTVIDDCADIPTTWRAKAGGPDEDGVPTSYYATVQIRGAPRSSTTRPGRPNCSPARSPTASPRATMPTSPSEPLPTVGCCPASAACACT
jgi:hypothetical protein